MTPANANLVNGMKNYQNIFWTLIIQETAERSKVQDNVKGKTEQLRKIKTEQRTQKIRN